MVGRRPSLRQAASIVGRLASDDWVETATVCAGSTARAKPPALCPPAGVRRFPAWRDFGAAAARFPPAAGISTAGDSAGFSLSGPGFAVPRHGPGPVSPGARLPRCLGRVRSRPAPAPRRAAPRLPASPRHRLPRAYHPAAGANHQIMRCAAGHPESLPPVQDPPVRSEVRRPRDPPCVPLRVTPYDSPESLDHAMRSCATLAKYVLVGGPCAGRTAGTGRFGPLGSRTARARAGPHARRDAGHEERVAVRPAEAARSHAVAR